MKRICHVVFVLILISLGIGTATSQDRAPLERPVPYLALGDSIPFGFNPFLADLAEAVIPLNTSVPDDLLLSFNGYPQDVSELLKLNLANASCPGQTSSSFGGLSPDNGCELWRSSGLPTFVAYSTPSQSQIAYAADFLLANRNTRLVTITIGGDDLLILLKGCGLSVMCVQNGLAEVLDTFATNLTAIYTAIRSTGYEGPIVAVNYPSADYTNTIETEALKQLNLAMLTVTKSFRGKVADAFSAFKLASGVEGLPCATGVGLAFVNYPSGQGCDVHPTALGQLLMAQLVLHALKPEDGRKEESLFFGLSHDTR